MAAGCEPSPLLVKTNTSTSEKWGYTQSKKIKFSYMWTIDNLSFRGEEIGEYINSPEFTTGPNDEYKWELRFYPKGKSEDYKGFASIYIRLLSVSHSCEKPKVMGTFKISILNAKKEENCIRNQNQALHCVTSEILGFPRFVLRDFLLDETNCLLPNDRLTILCDASIVAERNNVPGESNTLVQSDVPEFKLSQDFGKLLIIEKFSDVILEADGREIQAHKAILATRSDVFAAMFEHNTKENTLNRVSITDINAEVLEEMLHFIYTGKAPNLEKFAHDLLAAADKYALEKLKVMCEKELFTSLSAETAAETLTLAHLHNSDQLKRETMDFMKYHIADVVNTEGWQNLSTTPRYSSLLTEILQTITTQQVQEKSAKQKRRKRSNKNKTQPEIL